MAASVESKARWWFVGFLLVLAAAAAVWALAAAGRNVTYEIRSRDSVSGLIPGSPVEFHGVEVGRIRSVELVDPHLVRVLLDVRREVPVTSATVATITGRGLATRGFTGYVYVSLEDQAGPGRPLVAPRDSPYPLLATAPSQVVSLDTSISQLNENVQTLRELLQTVLDPDTVASLKESLAGVQQVTKTLSANNQKLVATLDNAERATARAHSAMARLEALSASTDQRLGVILRNTERASTRFEPLLESGNEAVRSLQTLILPEAHRTLVHLDQLSVSLGDTASRIRRNPALLLRGASPQPAGPGEAQ
jgi:phospholipid/cholesterol/gamma-HCH transport system substrate-binding protein